jgi:lysophospholipase L1-like esterase
MKSLARFVLPVSLVLNVLFLCTGVALLVRKEHQQDLSKNGPNLMIDSSVRRSIFMERAAANPHATVFLGDSITEFNDWSEVFGPQVLNRGISGDKTTDILARIGPIISLRPKRILLMVGINDLFWGRTTQATFNDYSHIVHTIRLNSPETTIYLESVLPVRPYGALVSTLGSTRRRALNQQIDGLNSAISHIADNRFIFYVDLNSQFVKDGILPGDLTVDGLHLNGAGYAIWDRQIQSLIAE